MRRRKALTDGTKPSLRGKTVAVSGATGGIGQALCGYLAELGADLILVDRSRERSQALADRLSAEHGIKAEHLTLDLEDTDRAQAVARELSERQVDHLVLNAGAYSIPRHSCSCGYDNVFTINFLSPYLHARGVQAEIAERGGRIVVVGSIAHRYSKTDPEDVDFSTRRAASLVYGNAKRHLMYALMGEECVSITHPGIAVTGITAHYPRLIYALIKYPMKLIFMSPRKAALSVLEGIFESTADGEWIGPRVLDVWGSPRRSTLRSCSDSEKRYIKATAEDIFNKIKN